MGHLDNTDHQCCQPVQIICICQYNCAFSVLDNGHCADICTICQKCQFEVRKGWQVLLFQSKAEDMYCNQTDSAILKLSFVEASMEQIYCITKQTYVVITLLCRGMGYVPFTRVLSWIAICRQYALFGFVLCRLLRRHLGFDSDFAQISGPKIGGWQLWLADAVNMKRNIVHAHERYEWHRRHYIHMWGRFCHEWILKTVERWHCRSADY